MYPPTRNIGQYQLLNPDPESTSDRRFLPFSKASFLRVRIPETISDLRRRRYFRPAPLLAVILLVVSLGRLYFVVSRSAKSMHWKQENFVFDQQSRPGYLGAHLKSPVVIRLAIVSRVNEFERRDTLQETMLNDIRSSDVQLDYKFVVGRARGFWGRFRLGRELSRHSDMVVLEDLNDVQERLSEKRYRALEWANSIPHEQYDYSMTTDSDAFCRLSALARRLRHEHPKLKPREQPILIARMLSNLIYFENTVPDGNINDSDEDYFVKGPWYPHPIGFGYLLSSNITQTIFSADPALPHHVNYPGDDVMIGSWIAGFKLLHDPINVFETVIENNPPPQHRVYPKPYLPYEVDTYMIDDIVGFHDFKNRGGKDSPVGWESLCVHRMTSKEMRAFRAMEEIKTE